MTITLVRWYQSKPINVLATMSDIQDHKLVKSRRSLADTEKDVTYIDAEDL